MVYEIQLIEQFTHDGMDFLYDYNFYLHGDYAKNLELLIREACENWSRHGIRKELEYGEHYYVGRILTGFNLTLRVCKNVYNYDGGRLDEECWQLTRQSDESLDTFFKRFLLHQYFITLNKKLPMDLVYQVHKCLTG